MDNPVNTTSASAVERGFLKRSRPVLYIAVIALAALAAYAHNLAIDGIYSCPASGYTADRYLAFCQGGHYGDYDHGGFWFGLESGIEEGVSQAKVIFLGSSRIQWAFSSPVTADWFARSSIPYYLLGFAFDETYRFEGPLLHKYNAHPSVYVISLDGFFAPGLSLPAQDIMDNEMAGVHYASAHVAQYFHSALCGPFPSLCGHSYSIYRSRQTGTWYATPARFRRRPVEEQPGVDQARVSQELVAARAFLDALPVSRNCVILTTVPTHISRTEEAAALAAALDRPFVDPQLSDLWTFDSSHLEKESAQRWAAAFLEAAGPRIHACVAGTAQAASR